MTTRPCKSSFLAPAPTPTLTGSEERRCLFRAAPSSLPPPLPTQSWEGDRKGAGLGRGGAGLDAFVCHGGGRRKGRGEPGSARERARCERGGRAGGGSFYLGRARLLAARLPGPRVTWGGGQVRTHWPPRRTSRRARPQAAEPSGGSVRPPTRSLCPAPACARRAPRSLRWAPRSRFPVRVTPPGARGGCGALGSPWWQRVPGARASPAARAEVPAERGPLTAPWPLPGPCPPARPLRPQLSMAQPPSLDHAQKLSKVDLLRVSLLWRPLREARVSIPVGGGGRRGAGSLENLLQRTWGPEFGGEGRFSERPVCPALASASQTHPSPGTQECFRGARKPGRSRNSAARRRPQRGSRVAASVPGAYFHLFGLQAPGVGRAFPPPGCAGRRARAERSPPGGRAGPGGGGHPGRGRSEHAPAASAQAPHPPWPCVSIHHPDMLKLP